jgi:hypothetical protein
MREDRQTIVPLNALAAMPTMMTTHVPTVRAVLVGGLLLLVGWSSSAQRRRAADAALDAADVERFDSDLG